MKTPDQRSVTVGTKSAEAFWADFWERNKADVVPEGAICPEEFHKLYAKNGESLDAIRGRLKRASRPGGELTELKLNVDEGIGLRMKLYYLPKVLTEAVKNSKTEPKRFTTAPRKK